MHKSRPRARLLRTACGRRIGPRDGRVAGGPAAVVRLAAAVFAITALVTPAALFAQTGPEAERAALRSFFQDGAASLRYTQAVANAVSVEQLQDLIETIETQVGRFTGVEGEGNPYTLRFTNGEASVYMVLDDRGRVAGLQFTRIAPATASLDEALDALLDRPGTTSVTILRDGEILVSRGSTDPLPVGSAFKLAVLAAAEAAVEEGRTSWDQVLRLEAGDRSLPSGQMQDWPADTAVTVETAAVLMISVSDNTATDLLIRHLGRGRIEEFAPNSRPVLTTREFFLLKSDGQADLRSRYREASATRRRQLLRELGQSEAELPPASLFAGSPVHPDIEWFFTTEELARLIEDLDRVDILGVNPGPVDPRAWREVGFKGGSEPGVMNLSLRLVAPSGTRYAISASTARSDARVDEQDFVSDLQSVLTHLR